MTEPVPLHSPDRQDDDPDAVAHAQAELGGGGELNELVSVALKRAAG